jgi:flagellar biosynthetic protein FliR
MNDLLNLSEQHPLLVLLVLTRISAALIAMPAIGDGVPYRIRASLSLLITLLILPTVAGFDGSLDAARLHPIELTLLLIREAIVGWLIGSTVRIAILGLQSAGELTSGAGGMQLAVAVDPNTGESLPTLSRWIGLLIIAIFLAIGGHRLVLAAMIDSFVAMPPGEVRVQEPMLDLLIGQWTNSVAAGIRVAAPVLLALLLSNIVTGLVSRTLPQLNVLAVGMSLNVLALLAVTTLTIGSAGYLFREELQGAVDGLSRVWFGPD